MPLPSMPEQLQFEQDVDVRTDSVAVRGTLAMNVT